MSLLARTRFKKSRLSETLSRDDREERRRKGHGTLIINRKIPTRKCDSAVFIPHRSTSEKKVSNQSIISSDVSPTRRAWTARCFIMSNADVNVAGLTVRLYWVVIGFVVCITLRSESPIRTTLELSLYIHGVCINTRPRSLFPLQIFFLRVLLSWIQIRRFKIFACQQKRDDVRRATHTHYLYDKRRMHAQ